MRSADDGRLTAFSGPGRHLRLCPGRLWVLRHGPWFTALNPILHPGAGDRDHHPAGQPDRRHLVQSLMLVRSLRLNYAGCPAPNGHYLCHAFAEKAFLVSFTDSRPLVTFQGAVVMAVRRRCTPCNWRDVTRSSRTATIQAGRLVSTTAGAVPAIRISL